MTWLETKGAWLFVAVLHWSRPWLATKQPQAERRLMLNEARLASQQRAEAAKGEAVKALQVRRKTEKTSMSCFGPALVLSEREESVSRWESNGSCCLLLQSSKGLPCVTALQEAQLNDVLFELDRRAAKLLLKPLDVDFVDS